MKHKILLFASGYKYSGSANGVCARNLVREFIHQGHEVFVIAVPHEKESNMEEIDGAKVWFVKDELQTRILWYLQQHKSNMFMRGFHKIYSLFRALLVAPLYPNAARIRVHNILKLSRKIIQKYGINTVIGTCLPYDGIAAAITLKKEYGDKIKVVTYHFDILSTPNNEIGNIYRFKKQRFAEAFDKELKIVDKVFLPETARDLHQGKKNIEFIGLPVYIPGRLPKIGSQFVFSQNVYNIVYIGSLDIRNRSVQPAINWLRLLNQESKKKYVLHIWGALADADTQIIIEKNKDLVEYHGMLENSKVKAVMSEADLLLNISNLLLYKLLPSKIFTMFSTGKPIVNIVNNMEDCALPYFRKYDNVLSINSKCIDIMESNPQHLIGRKVNADEFFIDYTPSVISNKLLKDD
mgnify:CR=1 FL=1